MIATLRTLHAIIGESLDQIESVYLTKGVKFPVLDKPYDGSSPEEYLANTDLTVRNAIQKAVSACGQIAASLQDPFRTLGDAASSYYIPSALRVLEGLPLALPLMAEAGETGVHVKAIAEHEGMRNESDPQRLAHIFRLLATHHILREVSPGDTFALNRISGCISPPIKGTKDIMTDLMKRYDNTDGKAAYVGICTDELFKASAYLLESILPPDHPFALKSQPSNRNGTTPNSAPFAAFNYAFNTSLGYFSWLESNPAENDKSALEQNYRLMRFAKAMTGYVGYEGSDDVWNALNWRELPAGSVVVDVGGGIGSLTMTLAQGLVGSDIKFIVQDRPPTVKLGLQIWRSQHPGLLDNETVTFQEHDFFMSQPGKSRGSAVYILRAILHSWPNKEAREILFRLREAASETTKLVVMDHILHLACTSQFDGGIQGVSEVLAPPPLLPNLGKANSNAYWLDQRMQTVFNSQERTMAEMVELCASAGWEVSGVQHSTGSDSSFAFIVATPIPGFKESTP